MLGKEQNDKTTGILGFRAISINMGTISMSSKVFIRCKLEKLERAVEEIKWEDITHCEKEWVLKRRTFKSRKEECIQIES